MGEASPTATHAPTATISPTATTTPALSVFQAPDGCLPDVIFQVRFDADHWTLDDDMLLHRRLADCKLWLIPSGTQVSGPLISGVATLAGRSWETRHFPTDGIISYIPLPHQDACYYFVAYYQSGAPDEVFTGCREAVEEVIDTVTSTSAP